MPAISIGMPAYNSETTLALAISSVLYQTFEDWELFIVDDGSADRTVEIARSFKDPRIKVFSDGQHHGVTRRLNQSIHLSTGVYFARMDSDDISYPERLRKQMDYLEHHPAVDLVGAAIVLLTVNGKLHGKRIPPETHSAIVSRAHAGFPMAHPTYTGKLSWFRKYQYRESARRCEDQDLLLRSYRHSTFANVPEILLAYREDKIDLKKGLIGRFFFTKHSYQEFIDRRQISTACLAVIEQVLKGALDITAVATGLNYRLLRRRAVPVTSCELDRWNQVWKWVNESTSMEFRTS
jgi:glycosyltransferase involved in cell wall biosynthesis